MVSVFRIVKHKVVYAKNQKKQYFSVYSLFVLCKFKNKQGDCEQIQTESRVHDPCQNRQGQLDLASYKAEKEIIRIKKRKIAIYVITEKSEVYKNRQERNNHSRKHNQEDPAVPGLVTPYHHNKGEQKKKEDAIKHWLSPHPSCSSSFHLSGISSNTRVFTDINELCYPYINIRIKRLLRFHKILALWTAKRLSMAWLRVYCNSTGFSNARWAESPAFSCSVREDAISLRQGVFKALS
jgi:hypothetical protein